jgi:site-specific DNA-methyltransferase (adenine-specific)
VSWWEKSGRAPDADTLPLVAHALSTTPAALWLAAGTLPPATAAALAAGAPMEEALADVETPTAAGPDAPRHRTLEEAPPPALRTELGRLYGEDCLEVLPHVPTRSVDCVFADPPFNLGKDYGDGVSDDLAGDAYLAWCRRWLDECVRVLKPGGALFVYNLPKHNIHLAAYLDRFLELKHWVAVDIKFSLPIPSRLYPSHYSLLYFVKGPRPRVFHPPRLPLQTCRHCGGELKDYGGYKDRMNPRGVNLTDVWTDIPPVRHRRHKNRGANELALKMLDRVLDVATDEGDLVLDPFGGSGTTFAACELKGRRWIGTELGDTAPIVTRLEDLEAERDKLTSLHTQVNVLFTDEALALRERHGHDTSRYRVER